MGAGLPEDSVAFAPRREVQKVRHAQTMGYRPCIIWMCGAQIEVRMCGARDDHIPVEQGFITSH